MWKILIGGTAAALVVSVVAVNLPDIKRYLKIRSM
ncbi:DUF6893 family small protein [Peterkaempfera bronchialis]